MGCDGNKDVKKLSSSASQDTVSAESAGATLARLALPPLKPLPVVHVRRSAYTGSPEDTNISKMDQDILLYMNQGPGENLLFSYWDFGGQDTFYGLYHLYMGRNSV
jgi:hypothetical protein